MGTLCMAVYSKQCTASTPNQKYKYTSMGTLCTLVYS